MKQRSKQIWVTALAAIWVVYSASVLGWHAYSTASADICITR